MMWLFLEIPMAGAGRRGGIASLCVRSARIGGVMRPSEPRLPSEA
jgi:hypothetical protein